MHAVQTILSPMYPVNQYMVIIRPSEAVINRIKTIRNDWKTHFNLQNTQLQGGFFMLAKFSQFAMLEQRVTDKIKMIAMEAAPFRLQLKDYTAIPDHSIGTGIVNPAGLKAIVKMLRREQRILKGGGELPLFNDQPGLWIATRLQQKQYDEIYNRYKNRHFTAAFVAENMILLRKAANQKQWTILENMPLQNLPVFSQQGMLF